MNCWLLKTEPTVYSIDDLARDGVTCWDGVRNYQARNLMRDRMQTGDLALIYHSNADPPAVVGIARIAAPAYPDHTAFDPKDPHYDPASTPERPVWVMVDVAFVEKLPRPVSLPQIKADPALAGMLVAQKGSRLSVQPVSEPHFRHVCRLAGAVTPL